MNYLLKQSLHQQIPIEMIYLKKMECTEKNHCPPSNGSAHPSILFIEKTMRTFRKDCILALAPIKWTHSSAHAVS